MKFIRQIRFEIRNILKSRFLFVMAILAVAASIAIPVLGYFNQSQDNRDGGGPIYPTVYYASDAVSKEAAMAGIRYPGPIIDGKGQSITIDGVTIDNTNPFFWNIQSLVSEKEMFETGKPPFSNPASIDLMLKLFDEEIRYYLTFAKSITTYQDYRMELAWRGQEYVYDLFFLEHNDEAVKTLEDVASYRKGVDPALIREKYIDITSEEKLAAIDKAEENLAMLQDIVVNNNFPKYIDMRIRMSRDEIKTLEENIAIQEKAIIDNPSQEQTLSQIIEDLRRQIQNIETNIIPILEYRLAKNIVPNLPIWQNSALNDVENSRSQLANMRIMTEKEWNESRSYMSSKEPGQTYQDYVAQMRRQIDALNKTLIVAQKSLDSDRPDMVYVPSGARNRTVEFLQYSAVITLFGILLGGWLIASEYQQGTIRLLMIRPKTRTKILMAKFTAALVVWLVVDLAACFLNLIANGVLFGFSDFAFPNYSVAGQTAFLLYYIPRMAACILPVLFAFTLAFLLSVVVKNIAIAIAVPILFYIGSVIMTNLFGYQTSAGWVAYTPIPFMQMASFFSRYSSISYLYERGINLSLTYGILLLLSLSVVFTAMAVLVFKKRDIVN